MKICPVCGHQGDDGEVFCGECGAKLGESAPVEAAWRPDDMAPSGGQAPVGQAPVVQDVGVAAPPPVKKSSGKRLVPLILAGVAGIAAIVVLVTFLAGVFASPSQKFASYQRKMLMEGVVDPLIKGIDEAGKKTFSTDMTLTASARGSRELDDLLDGSAISLKLDQKKNSLVASAGLTLQGDDIVEGTVSYEDGVFGFYVPRLDDTYYTVDLIQMMEELSGQDMSALENFKQPDIDTKLLKKLCERYIDVILSVANEENVAQSKDKKVSMNVLRGSERGTLYVCQPSAEDWEDMLLKLADTLEDDQELRDFALKYMQTMLESMGMRDMGDFEDVMDESLEETADALRNSAESFGQAAEDAGLTWSLCVKDKSFIRLTLELNDGEVCMGFEKQGDEMAFYYLCGSEQYVMQTSCEKDGGAYSGEVTAYYEGWNGRSGVTLSFEDVEKTKSALGIPRGVYTLEAEGREFELEVSKGDKGGTDHIFTVPDYMTNMGDIRVTLHTTDKKATCKLPKGKAVDITDYDQEELQDLFYDWQDEVEDMVSDIQKYASMGQSSAW